MPSATARRVLVVDDSKVQCAVWRKVLEERYGDKVKVETYTDPAEAVLAMAPDVHLLLLDSFSLHIIPLFRFLSQPSCLTKSAHPYIYVGATATEMLLGIPANNDNANI